MGAVKRSGGEIWPIFPGLPEVPGRVSPR